MATFDDVGSGISLAELEVSKAIGVVIGFKHRDQLPVPFYCQIVSQQNESQENQVGRVVNSSTLNIVLPVQPAAWSGSSGFSGAYSLPTFAAARQGVLEGDRVEYPIGTSGYYYVQGPIIPQANGYEWQFNAVKEQGTSLGNRS